MLDISRIEAGQLTLSLESVSVLDAVSETLDMVAALAHERGVTVSGPDSVSHNHVWADRQRTIQVLLNLLTNAVKYNRPGGEVRIRCEDASAGEVAIHVEDTGPGLAPEQLPRLFQAFDRLGAEVTTVEGTGIGLALSDALARAMRGRIEVDSVVGAGSVFTLVLPESPDRTPSAVDGVAPVSVGEVRSRRILYVEDNPANARLMQSIVRLRSDASLTVASTGAEGLDLAREALPDLVLLDLHLPDLSGHEVLSRLRADSATRDLVVVVLTADATTATRQRAQAQGADGFLTKPIEVAEVLRWIDGAGPAGPTP